MERARQARMEWTNDMHQRFLNAITSLGDLAQVRLFSLARSCLIAGRPFAEPAVLSSFPSFHADASPQDILDPMQVEGFQGQLMQRHVDNHLQVKFNKLRTWACLPADGQLC